MTEVYEGLTHPLKRENYLSHFYVHSWSCNSNCNFMKNLHPQLEDSR